MAGVLTAHTSPGAPRVSHRADARGRRRGWLHAGCCAAPLGALPLYPAALGANEAIEQWFPRGRYCPQGGLGHLWLS